MEIDFARLGRIYRRTELVHLGFFLLGMWVEGDITLAVYEKWLIGCI
jgi:hypothetical protein